MRNKIILIVILFTFSKINFACEICGCSTGNYFLSPLPQFYKQFAGMRYSFRNYNSEVLGDPTQYSKDFFQTTEIWGGINLTKKWQMLTFIPYNFNMQNSDDGKKFSHGFGDISLIANYKIYNKNFSYGKFGTGTNKLWMGAGIKLPTGRFDFEKEELAMANTQPGSGSTDFIVNATHILQLDNFGVNSNINYKIYGTANDYKFGNKFNAAMFFFRTLEKKNITINPNAGLLFENLQTNLFEQKKIENTGGYLLNYAVGTEIKFSKIASGFNVQLPLVQNLSNAQTYSKIRGMFHITYMF